MHTEETREVLVLDYDVQRRRRARGWSRHKASPRPSRCLMLTVSEHPPARQLGARVDRDPAIATGLGRGADRNGSRMRLGAFPESKRLDEDGEIDACDAIVRRSRSENRGRAVGRLRTSRTGCDRKRSRSPTLALVTLLSMLHLRARLESSKPGFTPRLCNNDLVCQDEPVSEGQDFLHHNAAILCCNGQHLERHLCTVCQAIPGQRALRLRLFQPQHNLSRGCRSA